MPAPARIAHAAGSLRGLSYTNSLEALEHHYGRGVRWFELDFSRDAHGAWWAVHEWSEVRQRLGIPLDPGGRGLPERQPPGGAFQLASLERVLGWFGDHPDARLVTDTKDDSRALLRGLEAAPPGLRARIHPQVYWISEYPLARAGGFGAPIFTTYRTRYPWWIIARFARRSPLLAVTVTRDEAAEACRALSGQVPLLTHTINDPAEAARLAAAGIAGVYTDDLLP
jgi:glycerophosphoryl diester phosphodiesterase